jgi:hypothetical protein
MISNEINPAKGIASWLKWLIGAVVTLAATGSGGVAILEYMEPEPIYAPTDNSVTVVFVNTQEIQSDQPVLPTNIQPSPQPTRTSPPPTVSESTPTPSRPSPVEFVVSYWQNVSAGRYEAAWVQ